MYIYMVARNENQDSDKGLLHEEPLSMVLGRHPAWWILRDQS